MIAPRPVLAFVVSTSLWLSACASSATQRTQSPADDQAAAEASPPEGMSQAEMAEMQAQMQELAKPGPEHAQLAKMAGEWKMESTFTMSEEPMVSTATVQAEMILGGRFLVQRTSGGEGPLAMDAYTIMGFDRRHNAFTIYGCDTLGTYCVGAEGPWDAATKTATMYGEDNDTTSGVVQKYDIVVKFIDDDTIQTQVIFHAGVFGNAEPMVAVTNISTRVKK